MNKSVLFVFLIFSLALSSCSPSVSGTSSGSEIEYEQKVAAMEKEDWEILSEQIVSETLTDQERENLDLAFHTGEISINLGEVSYSDGVVQQNMLFPNDGTVPGIVVPVIQFSSQNWQEFYRPFTDPAAKAYIWQTLFHWTGHLPDRYALASNGAWVAKTIRTAMEGNGLMYYLPATASKQAQYVYIAKMAPVGGGAPAPWAVLTTDKGILVTTFDTSFRHGAQKTQEAERYLAGLVKAGATPISVQDLPKEIKETWGGSNPPIYRYWYWAISYQVQVLAKMATISVAQAATKYLAWVASASTDFIPLIIIVPNCDGSADQDVFWCGPVVVDG